MLDYNSVIPPVFEPDPYMDVLAREARAMMLAEMQANSYEVCHVCGGQGYIGPINEEGFMVNTTTECVACDVSGHMNGNITNSFALRRYANTLNTNTFTMEITESFENVLHRMAEQSKASRKKKNHAQLRARKLLRTFLSPAQRKMLDSHHYFIESTRRYRYRFIPETGMARILTKRGKRYYEKFNICLHPEEVDIPYADITIGQLLWLRHDEKEFLRAANLTMSWWLLERAATKMTKKLRPDLKGKERKDFWFAVREELEKRDREYVRNRAVLIGEEAA